MFKFLKEKNREARNKRKENDLQKYRLKYDVSPSPSIPLEKIKTLALLRWDNKLGDSIMSNVLISNLQRYRPDIKITVITQSFCAEWFRKSTGVSIIICNKRSLETAKSFSQYKGKFDAVVELGSSFDFKELVAIRELGAAYNIGYNKNNYNIFNVCLNESAVHFRDRYLEVAKLFTGENLLRDIPLIPFSNESIVNKQEGVNNVAVNFFGSSKYRQFNLKAAEKFLNQWIESFPNDCLYLIPVPEKIDFLKSLKNKINNNRIKISSESPSLEHTLQILKQTDLCFSPDTSVVHLASALRSPIIAVYSDNVVNFKEWKPLSPCHEVIFNVPRKRESSRTYVYDFDWDELVLKRNKLLAKHKEGLC